MIRSRSTAYAVMASVVSAGAALAQPQPQQPPQPFPPPTGDAPVEPAPQPEPPPQPEQPTPPPVQQTPAAAPAPAPTDEPALDQYRPSAFSVGIGLGYRIHPLMTFQTPDVTSVRFRLPTGLTIEPRVVLSSSKDEHDTGMTTKNRDSEIGFGGVVRLPWMRRGRADLEILGALDLNSAKDNPEGDDNSTRFTTFALGYGLAVNVWLWQHLNVSMSAGNSLFTIVKTRQENGIPDDVTVDTTTTFALIFDPTVLFMAHLYL